MRRRLAAVMAADIVGYTRLMGADEEGTLKALMAFRAEVFGPTVAGHDGTIVKSMGDGWLVEFESAVDAVNCALKVQEQLDGHPILKLRIGVNIGDIVHEHEDIFGDGVNVAARLQETAPPGGVALSGSVYDSLDGTLGPAFADAGMHDLKNVARQVHVWLRAPSGSEPSVARPGAAAGGHRAGFSALAIQPIERPAARPELSDLADALTGDFLRLLGSSDWLRPRITGKAERTDYVLSGVLRARGAQMRLEVELAAPSNELVWSGAFDGELSESFAWQDSVVPEIAANVFGGVFDMERDKLFSKPEAELSAVDCLLCGVLEFFEISDDALTSALHYFDLAMQRDEDLGAAYAQAIRCVFAAIAAGYRHRLGPHLARIPVWLDRAERLYGASDALELCKAIWSYLEQRDTGALEAVIKTVLRRAPFDTDVLCLAGWSHVWLGQPEKAIDCFRKFERLGRFSSFAMAARGGLAMAYVQAGRDHAAIEQAGAVLRTTRDFSVPFRALAAAAAHIGRLPEARDAVANVLRLVPDDSLHSLRERAGFADTPATSRFFEGLRLAGLPEKTLGD